MAVPFLIVVMWRSVTLDLLTRQLFAVTQTTITLILTPEKTGLLQMGLELAVVLFQDLEQPAVLC